MAAYQNSEFGLLVTHHNQWGSEHVDLKFVRLDEATNSPRNCISDYDDDYPKHMWGGHYYDLGMTGFVSDYGDCRFACFEPSYSNVSSINYGIAKRMAHTLKKLETAIRVAQAYDDAPDMMQVICSSLKLTFVIERADGEAGPTSLYSDISWRIMSVPEGKRRYRELIEQARARVKAKVAAKQLEEAAE